MAPLAGDGMSAAQHFSTDADTTTHAGAGNDAEYNLASGSGSVRGFRKRKTVCVIRDSHGSPNCRRDILVQRMPDQHCRVGVLHQACLRADDSGNRKADRSPFAKLFLGANHQIGDC